MASKKSKSTTDKAAEKAEKQARKVAELAKEEAKKARKKAKKAAKLAKEEATKLARKAKERAKKDAKKAAKKAEKPGKPEAIEPTPAPAKVADPAPITTLGAPTDDWSVVALRARAREVGLTGYSRMTKAELLAALST